MSKESDSVIITFRSRPRRVYAVDASENLKDWEELDDGVGSEEGSDLTEFIDNFFPEGARQRYYRVRELE